MFQSKMKSFTTLLVSIFRDYRPTYEKMKAEREEKLREEMKSDITASEGNHFNH